MADGTQTDTQRVGPGNDAGDDPVSALRTSAAPSVKRNALQEGHGDERRGGVFPTLCPGRPDLRHARRRQSPVSFRAAEERRAPALSSQSDAKPPDYEPRTDRFIVPEANRPRETGGLGTFERGGQNLYTTRIHKSETVDYGIQGAGGSRAEPHAHH
jgi:hypothetical protein